MKYDSRPETLEHIGTVQGYLAQVIGDIKQRAAVHDASKLDSPEKEVFDEYTPLLRASTYGSDEYKAHLEGMGEGLKHHYAHNRHHPEFWEHGIADMGLCDLIEMLADWKAATLRHDDGDLERSIRQNALRFGYGREMTELLLNTARDLGWL